MPGPIRVAVVDDHPSILAAVSAAIGASEGLLLVGTGRSLDEAIALAHDVDVLVCDVQLDGQADGLRALEMLRALPDPPAVLLISGYGHPSVVRTAVERGAAGYLDKTAEMDAIVDAIRTVAGGGTVFQAADLAASRDAPRRPSDRELEVIAAVVGGRTNAETAAALGVSEKTIETHLHRLFDRYGVLSRTELAVFALEQRWVGEGQGTPG